MMKKVFVLMYALLIIHPSILGQNNSLLNVKKVIQKGDVLCWAASIEMILHFNNPSNGHNQCTVVEKMKAHYGGGTVICTPCPAGCATTIPTPSNCDFSAQKPFIMKLLNKQFKFNLQDSPLPNWETIKINIKGRHPFIGFMGYPTAQCASDHVVVVRGYRTVDTNKFYLINDPLSLCSQPNYQQILFTNRPNVMTICSYLSEMYPLLIPNGLLKDDIVTNPDSTSVQSDKQLSWKGEITQNLTQKQLDTLLKGNNYTAVEKLYYDTKTQKQFSTMELTYLKGEKPYTRTTLQKIDNQWLPVRIEQTEQDFFEIVRPKSQDMVLTNKPSEMITTLEMKPYKKIVLLPTGRQFYFFYLDKELRFLPITDDKTTQKLLTLADMKKMYKIGAYFDKLMLDLN
ncbi:MAG: hypothetical protein JNL70_28330 [Saprospiraceae bacterium]|nr:hypothetical protein [Saprospiraceae bacterium]